MARLIFIGKSDNFATVDASIDASVDYPMILANCRPMMSTVYE